MLCDLFSRIMLRDTAIVLIGAMTKFRVNGGEDLLRVGGCERESKARAVVAKLDGGIIVRCGGYGRGNGEGRSRRWGNNLTASPRISFMQCREIRGSSGEGGKLGEGRLLRLQEQRRWWRGRAEGNWGGHRRSRNPAWWNGLLFCLQTIGPREILPILSNPRCVYHLCKNISVMGTTHLP